MSFLTIFQKMTKIQKLMEEFFLWCNTNAGANLIGLTDDFQDQGTNNEYLFPEYVAAAKKFREAHAKLFPDQLSMLDYIVDMWKAEINSDESTTEMIIHDIQEYMHNNTNRILSRGIARNAITYSSNAGVIVTHSTDYLGYAIETDWKVGKWTVRCQKTMHDNSTYYYGGLFSITPDDYVDSSSGDGLVDANNTIYSSKAINYSTSTPIMADTFASYDSTNGFSNWESANWTNIDQDTTEFVFPKIGTRTATLTGGAGDSVEWSGDASMWHYLNNVNFNRYVPYTISVAYKYADANADGTMTLSLGSQSVATDADGLGGAITGTTEFKPGVGNEFLVGTGTKYLSELKPGDLVWNSTDDTIADARIIKEVTSDTAAELTVVYAGTAGAGKNCSIKYCGWHRLYMVKYLGDFEQEDIYAKLEKTGHGAGNIYTDDIIIRPMNWYPQVGRYIDIFADQVEFNKDDNWYWTDVQAVRQGWNQEIFIKQYGISLPHNDPADAGYSDI